MVKRIHPLETELLVGAVALAVHDELFAGGNFAADVALVECSEYDFLDSSVVISNDAAGSIAVCNLSALIAKQCKVHQIEC